MPNQLLKKVFSNPQLFRNILLEAQLISSKKNQFSGKSFICVSLTRFCSVGCDFCFFKSGNPFQEPTKKDRFFAEGQKRFIEFANSVNLGYLLVSGGGEPMMEKSTTIKIISEVISDRIVLVTSGNWAKEKSAADVYLSRIAAALRSRKSPTQLTVRLSFDEGHTKSLGFFPAKNLIELFKTKYSNVPNLDFQIHTFQNDSSLERLISELREIYSVSTITSVAENVKDGASAIKFVPRQATISFDGYHVKVGFAKLFYSNLLVDLNQTTELQKNIEVFQKDIMECEEGNPSVVTNYEGSKGLDFWVNYNGNVTSWGNQYLDNLMNIYVDSASCVIQKTLSDPAAYAFLEQGAEYRDRIINEINPIAVLRGKAVNIRDYTSSLMFDEARTRLYYTIRVLQDYKQAGRVSESVFNMLSEDLQQVLQSSQTELKKAYINSDYTIVEQTMNKNFSKLEVLDILTWIKLGHYQLSEEKVNKLVRFYNQNVSSKETLQHLSNLPLENDVLQIVRMTEHLTHIKSEALEENCILQKVEVL